MTTIVSPFEFGLLTGRGAPMPPNVADVYYGHSFQCGCGSVHTLDASVQIPRVIPGRNKFVACCPATGWVNFLKVKGFFRIAGLETICLTQIETEKQDEELSKGLMQSHFGYVLVL